MYILTNISRNKDNPAIKFGQLIEYNMRNIRIQNHVQNMVEKLNRAYLWINNLKFYTVRFYCMPSWGLSKYIEIKLQTTCFYLIQIEAWNWSPCLIFYMIFEEKYVSCYILLPDQISLTGCFYVVRYWGKCVNFIFLIKPLFSTWPKSQDKNLISSWWKELLRWNKKHFSSFLKGFYWSK